MPTYLWTALAVAAVWTLWLFIYWPRRIFPPSRSSKREEIVADIKARNDLRMTIAQFLAGGAFVVTFISSTTNFNRDIRQRTDAALAQDYSRAIAQIGNSENTRWQTIGSLYLLVKIAKQDPEYHQPVFSTIGRYLVPPAQTGCADGSDQTSSYTILPELDIAARIYGERNLDLEVSGEPRRNLDSICLSDAELYGVQGFRGAWMPKARLFRVDLRSSNLRNADLREARAGVIHVDTWRSVRDEYPDPLVNPVSELIKKQDENRLNSLRADFSNSDFSWAYLNDASFEGADFHNSTFVGTWAERTHFEMANLQHTQFIPDEGSNPAQLTDAHWVTANAEDAEFKRAILIRADFKGAVLKRVDFSGANLTDAAFNNADLEGAIFDGANVTRANFENAKGFGSPQLAKACVDSANEVASQPKGIPGSSVPRCAAITSSDSLISRLLYGLRKLLSRDP